MLLLLSTHFITALVALLYSWFKKMKVKTEILRKTEAPKGYLVKENIIQSENISAVPVAQ